jgi:hypothetical protein
MKKNENTKKCKTINSATKIPSTYKQGRRKQCEAACGSSHFKWALHFSEQQ